MIITPEAHPTARYHSVRTATTLNAAMRKIRHMSANIVRTAKE